jgi:hypothetical protein
VHKIDEKFNENGGVYILKCSTEINNFIPVIANRLIECGKNGILYIGKANSFIDRVIDLKKAYLLNIIQVLLNVVQDTKLIKNYRVSSHLKIFI